jgi:hypothetical protein
LPAGERLLFLIALPVDQRTSIGLFTKTPVLPSRYGGSPTESLVPLRLSHSRRQICPLRGASTAALTPLLGAFPKEIAKTIVAVPPLRAYNTRRDAYSHAAVCSTCADSLQTRDRWLRKAAPAELHQRRSSSLAHCFFELFSNTTPTYSRELTPWIDHLEFVF